MKKYFIALSLMVTSTSFAMSPKAIKCFARPSQGQVAIPFDQVETFDVNIKTIEVYPEQNDLSGFSPQVRINGVLVKFTAGSYLLDGSVKCARLSKIGTDNGPVDVKLANQVPLLEIKSATNSQDFSDGSIQGFSGAHMDLSCRAK